MIVVDSSVWITWFRKVVTAETEKLAKCRPGTILLGDIVLLEVLRGARDESQARRMEANLRAFDIVPMLDGKMAAKSATNYRQLRLLGVTIRSVPDLIIGTYCIEHGHMLLQNDRDFLPMAEHLGLKLA